MSSSKCSYLRRRTVRCVHLLQLHGVFIVYRSAAYRDGTSFTRQLRVITTGFAERSKMTDFTDFMESFKIH